MFLCRRFLLPIAFCMLIAVHGNQGSHGSEPGTDLRAVRLAKMRATVQVLEDQLQKVERLLTRQLSSEAEVDLVRAELAKARHDVALLENNRAEAVKQLRQLVEIRERELKRYLKTAGRLSSKRKIFIAQRRLVAARYFLDKIEGKSDDSLSQLQHIVELCKQEVEELTRLRVDGGVSAIELNSARHRLNITQYQLAREQNDVQSIIPQIRSSVELCEQEWEQIKRLKKLDLGSYSAEYFAHCHYLKARIMLAELEKKPNVVINHFNLLISTHEETIPNLEYNWPEREVRMWIERELARDRERKEQFSRDGFLDDDLSPYDLEI